MDELRLESLAGAVLYVRKNTWDVRIASEVVDGAAYRVTDWQPTTESPVVFDVGGHIGSFSALLASRHPTAKIYAFEMDADNQAVLTKNVERWPNVTVVPAALGGRTGEATRTETLKPNTGGAEVSWDRARGRTVPAKSAAQFVTESGIERIDMLKLSCKGSELEIVSDLAKLPGGLRKHVGRLVVQIHGSPAAPRVEALLELLVDNFEHVSTRSTRDPSVSTLWASNDPDDAAARRSTVVLGVPVFNRYDLLAGLVASALASSRLPERIVVVDNGGRFDAAYAGRLDRVEVVRPGKNTGTAGGWNAVFRAAGERDVVVMANDDVTVTRDGIAALAAAVEDHRGGAMASDHTVPHHSWSLYAMSRQLWDRIGPFDERFWPAYFEDDDYERRLALHGVSNLHVKAIRSHVGSASTATKTPAAAAQFAENRARYVEKWGAPPPPRR